ncbi:MAG: hypothetical protein ACRDGV_11645 [Candidatus Limnocylindria bacterium]
MTIRTRFERLRLPIGLVLLVVLGFVLFPRDDGEGSTPAPTASQVIVLPVGGEARPAKTPTPAPTPAFTPIPTVAARASPTPVPTPSAPPVSEDDAPFGGAEVLACRSISGSSCDREINNLPPNADSFVALVRFTDARAGDVMNAILDGPSGEISGGGYTLQGGGDGYYYSTFQAGGLPAGEYTVTATRNGTQIATTSFTKRGP